MKTLGVHIAADDLGLSKGVTDSILRCADCGAVDRTSVIADGPDVGRAIAEWSRRSDRIELALHLNLTDGNNSRHSFLSLLLGYMLSLPDRRALLRRKVRSEISRQMKIVRGLAGDDVQIGIDGHQHVHMIPFVLEEICALSRELKIARLRIPLEPFYIARPYRAYAGPGMLKHILLNILARRALPIVRRSGMVANDYAGGILHTGQMNGEIAMIIAAAGAKKFGRSAIGEIIFHPGVPSEKERAALSLFPRSLDWSYSRNRGREAEALLDTAFMRERGWHDFWNGEHSIYVSPTHMKAHYEAIAKDVLSAISVMRRPIVLLDYGCGDALASPAIAASGVGVIAYDPAPNVRSRARKTLSGGPGISIPEDDPLDKGIPVADVILLNSVIQYLKKRDLVQLLTKLRAALKADGMLIIADIVPPDSKTLDDVRSLLTGALRYGYFFRAVRSLVRTFFSDYRSIKSREGFATYSESEILSILNTAGFVAHRAERNIGLTPHRMTFVAKHGINFDHGR